VTGVLPIPHSRKHPADAQRVGGDREHETGLRKSTITAPKSLQNLLHVTEILYMKRSKVNNFWECLPWYTGPLLHPCVDSNQGERIMEQGWVRDDDTFRVQCCGLAGSWPSGGAHLGSKRKCQRQCGLGITSQDYDSTAEYTRDGPGSRPARASWRWPVPPGPP